MEYITWVCKDCGYQWVGDKTDSWCPACDENNIYAPFDLLEEDSEYKEVTPIWLAQLKDIKQCPQRQDSLQDQLRDLRIIANKFGFYDAADYLKTVLDIY